jgi:Rieske Fe-S protein
MSSARSSPRLGVLGCAGGCSRRALLQGLGVAAVGAVVLGPGCGRPESSLPTGTSTSCGANLCLDLSDASNAALVSVGGALVIDSARDTIMVIRISETAIKALSAICTHSGCSMDFDPAQQVINCPCHGSQFAEDGSVITGPARRDLQVYNASLTANIVTITA